jgi:hypothetical protein
LRISRQVMALLQRFLRKISLEQPAAMSTFAGPKYSAGPVPFGHGVFRLSIGLGEPWWLCDGPKWRYFLSFSEPSGRFRGGILISNLEIPYGGNESYAEIRNFNSKTRSVDHSVEFQLQSGVKSTSYKYPTGTSQSLAIDANRTMEYYSGIDLRQPLIETYLLLCCGSGIVRCVTATCRCW